MSVSRLAWMIRRCALVMGSRGKLKLHWLSISDAHSTFGIYVRLASRVRFHHASIGDYSYAAAGARIAYADIGKFCSIGPEVMIGGLGRHPVGYLSSHPYFYSSDYRRWVGKEGGADFDELPRTKIGNDVWIGARAIVLDGITVGDGAIVAAGAVVVKDVAPYTIVGGVPARFISTRSVKPFDDPAPDWWNWPDTRRDELATAMIAALDDTTRAHPPHPNASSAAAIASAPRPPR